MRVLLIDGHPSNCGTLEQVLDLELADLGGLVVLKMLRAVSDVAIVATAAGESRVARLGDRELVLTRKEFDVLAYLARRSGAVVSKRELAAQVWRDPFGGCDRTVEILLSWLRQKLGESAAEPRYLRTVRGVGVKVVEPAPNAPVET
jgi:DNA-binding response OmpR family regulator